MSAESECGVIVIQQALRDVRSSVMLAALGSGASWLECDGGEGQAWFERPLLGRRSWTP